MIILDFGPRSLERNILIMICLFGLTELEILSVYWLGFDFRIIEIMKSY